MLISRKILFAPVFLLLIFTFFAPAASAEGNEYKAIVKHLKTKYQAKKVKIPMLWLARLAVKVVRPAGVQSFSVTMFENLKFSSATLDGEMQSVLKNSFSADWNPVFHVRSREGEQVYMYMKEAGASVKLTLVTINKNQAAVIRATFSPEKLTEFVNNPKIFGITLSDDNQQAFNKTAPAQENATSQSKVDEQ